MSLFSSPRNQHRKFITLVLSLSLAVTGFSAAPARADEDVLKFIAGAALLGILGAAINDARHDRRANPSVVTPPRPPHPGPRPLPPHVAKYDLPAQCVRYFPRYSNTRTLLGQKCLRKNYQYMHSLPQSCRVTFWNGQRNRAGYKPRCLQRKGYRLVQR
ncbi:hypothetical protein [Phycobacter sp. K97]|uniref:hypothetical protein n=1 Tax=Phycobacter sedimenti TaxID=3133977 RepID=UPI00311DC016